MGSINISCKFERDIYQGTVCKTFRKSLCCLSWLLSLLLLHTNYIKVTLCIFPQAFTVMLCEVFTLWHSTCTSGNTVTAHFCHVILFLYDYICMCVLWLHLYVFHSARISWICMDIYVVCIDCIHVLTVTLYFNHFTALVLLLSSHNLPLMLTVRGCGLMNKGMWKGPKWLN